MLLQRATDSLSLKVAAGQHVVELSSDDSARREQPAQVHSRLPTAAVQRIDKVFSRQVTTRPRRIRAATETTARGIKGPYPCVERGEHVGQRSASRVVEMQRDLLKRDAFCRLLHPALHITGRRDTNRIAD